MLATVSGVWAQNNKSSDKGELNHLSQSALLDKVGRVVIYRDAQSVTGSQPKALVYLNGVAYAELQRNMMTVLCVKPGTWRLTAAMPDEFRAEDKSQTGKLPLDAGKTVYLKLRENLGNIPAALVPVSKTQAESELKGVVNQRPMPQYSHEVVPCEANDNAVAPVAVGNLAKYGAPGMPGTPGTPGVPRWEGEEKFTLTGDAVFVFSKSGEDGVLPKGKEEVKRIAKYIRDNYIDVKRVTTVGHTDPISSDELNDKLSLERAQTVRDLLVAAGLPANTMTVEGRGRRELVKWDCEQKDLKERAACLQPNRRVEITVNGVRKGPPPKP